MIATVTKPATLPKPKCTEVHAWLCQKEKKVLIDKKEKKVLPAKASPVATAAQLKF